MTGHISRALLLAIVSIQILLNFHFSCTRDTEVPWPISWAFPPAPMAPDSGQNSIGAVGIRSEAGFERTAG
jgi:hypothetical protein